MRKLFFFIIIFIIANFISIGYSAEVALKNVKLKLHELNGVQYISAQEFADIQNIRTISFLYH